MGGAPVAQGPRFAQRWDGKKLSDFYGFIHGDMPLGLGASLPSQEYADIVAFLLAQNGLPAGTDKFTPYSPMDRVLQLNEATAAGVTVAAATPGQIRIGALYGKLAQPTTQTPTQAELDGADGATGSWLMYNKGYRGERYSSLTQINTAQRGEPEAAVPVSARASWARSRPVRSCTTASCTSRRIWGPTRWMPPTAAGSGRMLTSRRARR